MRTNGGKVIMGLFIWKETGREKKGQEMVKEMARSASGWTCFGRWEVWVGCFPQLAESTWMGLMELTGITLLVLWT